MQTNAAYIDGYNSESAKIPMTEPTISMGNGTTWRVGVFIPASIYPLVASVPVPQFDDMSIVPLKNGTAFAVYEFGGFAGLDDFQTYTAQLKTQLSKDGVRIVDDADYGVVWAEYSPSSQVFNRHNEAWVQVDM